MFADGFVTVARADHPRLVGDVLTLEAFLAEDHLLVSPRGAVNGHVDDALAARGLRRRVARTVPSFLAAIWHIGQSDHLLTVSRRLVNAVRDRLPLSVWAPPVPLEDYPIWLVWHPRVDSDAEHAWFRSVITGAAERLDG